MKSDPSAGSHSTVDDPKLSRRSQATSTRMPLRSGASWAEGLSGSLFSCMLKGCHPRDIVNVRASCRAWRDLIHEDLSEVQINGLPQRVSELEALGDKSASVLQQTVLAGSVQLTRQHMKAITAFRSLTSLTLSSSKHITQQGLNQLSTLSNLQLLDLIAVKGTLQLHRLTQLSLLSSLKLGPGSLGFATANPASVIRAVNFSKLHRLHLDLKQKHSGPALSDISLLKSVPELSLKCCLEEDDKHFVSVLLAMPNVVYLELDVPCQRQGLATSLALDQMPSLQVLTLQGFRFPMGPVPPNTGSLKGDSLPLNWLESLTCVTSLKIIHVPRSVLASVAQMTWLLDLTVEYNNGLHGLSQMTQLTRLYLSSCDQDMQANSTFLEPLTNLVGLRLPSISPLPCGFSTVSAMTCLTYLNMGGMISMDKHFDHTVSALSSLSNLCVLRWDSCGQLTDHCIEMVALLQHLTDLRLSEAMFPPGLSALHRLSWLHKLTLRSCTDTEGALTDYQMKDLCNIKGLSSFVLVNCKLSDNVCSHFYLLCSLQHLEIQQQYVLTYRVFHHMGQVTTVQSLRIEGGNKMCMLQREMKHFARLFRLCSAAFELYVDHPKVHEECLKGELLKQYLPHARICYNNTNRRLCESSM